MDDFTCQSVDVGGLIDYEKVPNPAETCVMTVAGRRFTNFETVMVQRRWSEAWPIFQFTTADIVESNEEPPKNWRDLQFKPGDECAIYLGGELAIAGVITARQTAYDKQNKGVMLAGVGVTWYAAKASITGKANFDNKSFEQVAAAVLAPFGIKYCKVGTLNATPFVKLQVEPGETVWSFLERIARPRGIVLGSDHQGQFIFIGDHSGVATDTLKEGVNILRMQATITVENIFSNYVVRGQTAGNDLMNMVQAAEQEGSAPGTAKRYSPLLTTAEQPVWTAAELTDRAKNESIWHEGTIVEAVVTVQGWQRPSTSTLWAPGFDVYLDAPMALIQQPMKIDTVTFTQSRDAGTLTNLLVVPPWKLKDHIWDFRDGVAPPVDPNQQPATPATSPEEFPPQTLGP